MLLTGSIEMFYCANVSATFRWLYSSGSVCRRSVRRCSIVAVSMAGCLNVDEAKGIFKDRSSY